MPCSASSLWSNSDFSRTRALHAANEPTFVAEGLGLFVADCACAWLPEQNDKTSASVKSSVFNEPSLIGPVLL
jgi:hypothetical protein